MKNVAKKVLQWPLDVLPLLKRALLAPPINVNNEIGRPEGIQIDAAKQVMVAKAIMTAVEIAAAGVLDILEYKVNASLYVCSPVEGYAWTITIYPEHVEAGWQGPCYDLRLAKRVKFRARREAINSHLVDPSAYLAVEYLLTD
jgi:hypothetical protein